MRPHDTLPTRIFTSNVDIYVLGDLTSKMIKTYFT